MVKIVCAGMFFLIKDARFVRSSIFHGQDFLCFRMCSVGFHNEFATSHRILRVFLRRVVKSWQLGKLDRNNFFFACVKFNVSLTNLRRSQMCCGRLGNYRCAVGLYGHSALIQLSLWGTAEIIIYDSRHKVMQLTDFLLSAYRKAGVAMLCNLAVERTQELIKSLSAFSCHENFIKQFLLVLKFHKRLIIKRAELESEPGWCRVSNFHISSAQLIFLEEELFLLQTFKQLFRFYRVVSVTKPECKMRCYMESDRQSLQ